MLADRGRSSWAALLVSLAVHGAGVGVAAWLVAREARAASSADAPVIWGWAGDTFDIEGLVEDPVPGADIRAAAAAEAASPPPAAEPAAKEPAPPIVAVQPRLKPPEPRVQPSAERADHGDAPPAGSARTEESAPSASEHSRSTAGAPGADDASGSGRADSSASEQEPGGSGGEYGAAGDRRSVRPLAPAFTRAIPPAVNSDPAWARLPIGPAGQTDITIVVDAAGAISRVVVPDEAPLHLQDLVERTMVLLRAGRFALPAVPGAGEATLRIAVVLSQREPIEGEHLEPTDALRLGFEPGAAGKPGKAYFTLASGRHFEALVSVESTKPAGGEGPQAPPATDPPAKSP